MDFIAEYAESKKLPIHIAVTYKFFSLFKVDTDAKTLAWTTHTTPINPDVALAAKLFLKDRRAVFKQGAVNKSECSRSMWFWYQKILDVGAFTHEVRLEILRWMEICELIIS